MAASKRIKIKMVCSEGSGHFYTTTINPQNTQGKLQRLKYNPKLRRRVLYVQSKIK